MVYVARAEQERKSNTAERAQEIDSGWKQQDVIGNLHETTIKSYLTVGRD